MSKEILLAALRSNADFLADMVAAIPAADLERVRKPGFWSIGRHLNHLVITNIMLTRRIELFLREVSPAIQPYIPQDDESSPQAFKDAKELVAAFGKWRDKQVGLIEGCADDVWARKGVHPEYKAYTFEILVRHIVLHDHYHLNRIEELWLLRDDFLKPL